MLNYLFRIGFVVAIPIVIEGFVKDLKVKIGHLAFVLTLSIIIKVMK